MIETGLTTITWFILVSLFLPQAGIRLANHGLLNLVRAGPDLLNLVQAGHCLIKLVWNGHLIIGDHGSGTALSSATAVVADSTDVATVAAMSVVAAALRRVSTTKMMAEVH